MTESLVLARAKTTATSLELPAGLSFEEWQETGGVLNHIEGAIHWWIGDWCNYGERAYGETYAQAIEQTGYAYQTVAHDAWVAGKVEVCRRRQSLSFAHHQEVAKLEPTEQAEWLDKAEENSWTRRELRRALAPDSSPPALPAGTWDVLLADPPWQYDFAETDSRAIENQYPTMPVEVLCGLAVPGITAEDAVLFLWATAPKLREGLEVMEAWGFTYLTNLVWVKDKIGMGYWARGRHEFLLIGKRGHFPAPEESSRPDSVIEAPRLGHSAKPEVVYDLIETMCPDRTYLELFARSAREGWASWGNEIP